MGRVCKIAADHPEFIAGSPAVIHLVDRDSRTRAEYGTIIRTLGYHAEVYSDIEELIRERPKTGIVLVRQHAKGPPLGGLLGRLDEASIFVPVMAAASDPETGQVVEAIRHGALDYLCLPMELNQLALALQRAVAEAEESGWARRQLVETRRRIGRLSKREGEVLELLVQGCSNKIIARALGISPRTVELHRARMMLKLDAKHAADAIRLWLLAHWQSTRSQEAPGYDCVLQATNSAVV